MMIEDISLSHLINPSSRKAMLNTIGYKTMSPNLKKAYYEGYIIKLESSLKPNW